MPANREIEARFPDIVEMEIRVLLSDAGAEDLGEDLFEEIAFQFTENDVTPSRFVRVRKTKDGTSITYKDFGKHSAIEATEIELSVNDILQAEAFLRAIGLVFARRYQKKRHDFMLNGCKVSIDTYPRLDPFLEIEGPSEEVIKETTELLGLKWQDAYLKNALHLLIEKRGLKVDGLKTYTFDTIEYA